jgi:protein-disulfide isomerase
LNGPKLLAGVAATTALVGMIIYTSMDAPTTATAAASSSTAPQAIDPQWAIRTKGDSNATITIFEMSDFLCPWCKLFADSTYPIIDRDYIETGKVQLIFVNLPIPSLHPNAPAAHEFAMCAGSQGKFWELHDMLFERQEAWRNLADLEPYFLGLAEEVGLSEEGLNSCLDSGEMRALVSADVNTARQAQVASTPTFVVRPTQPPGEAIMIPGAAGIEVWKPLLDSIIALKEGG